MLAVDTNVIVRLLTGDDKDQLRIAGAVFRREEIWVSKTVLLETEWVLRSHYGLPSVDVCRALRSLVALPNVETENESAVLSALALCQDGLDFADAIHITSIGPAHEFATFDRRLAKRAQRVGRLPVRAL